MRKIIFIYIILFPVLSFAQFDKLFSKEPSDEPIIHYYNFYNGVQMIRLDYLSSYENKVSFLEQTQPRALEWREVLGGPRPNVYIFRNENGEILKQFGETDIPKLLSVKKSLEVAQTHSSLGSIIGTSIGFTNLTTSYFPYYLINNPQSFLKVGRHGLIDSSGNVVLPNEYDQIWKGDNLFITCKDGYNELRNINLEIKFRSNVYRLQPSQFHRESVDIFKHIEGNSHNYKVGLMNSFGKIVVECKYDMSISSFNEFGLAQVRRDHLYGFIDTTGNELINCKYQSVGKFKDELLPVRLNDKWGYVNIKGKTVIKHQFEGTLGFSDGMAIIIKREGLDSYYYGFIDKTGKIVIPTIYTKAEDFKDGIAKVRIDGTWIEIDKNGNKVR